MASQSIDAALSGAGEPHLATRGSVDLILRPARRHDAERLTGFYDGPSADDMRFRFLNAQSQLSTSQLSALIYVDHRHREYLLAFARPGGTLAATLLMAANNRFEDAEVAISVVPAYQRRGFGWSLLHHLIDLARERGIACLRSTKSRANRDAIEIERTLGFKSRAYEGDARLH